MHHAHASDMRGVGKDLTKEAPRSPHEMIGGFKIIARTIDKCRAKLWGNIGEYHFDCPLDNQLFGFMGIKGEEFKSYVAEGRSDLEIAAWVRAKGVPRTEREVSAWNKKVSENDYRDAPEKAAWLSGEVSRLGLPAGTTLFEYLIADDAASLPSAAVCPV